MRRLIVTAATIFICSVLLVAQGTLSVPFTAEQQDGVQWRLDQVNAERSAQAPPLSALALQPFGIQVCQTVFTDFVLQRARERELRQSVYDKYIRFNDPDKTSVEAYIDACIKNGGCA